MSRRGYRAPGAQRLVRWAPAIWLTLFFAAPFLLVVRLGFSEAATAQPPYRPVIDWSEGLAGVWAALQGLRLDNYALLLSDPLYVASALTSLQYASAATVLLLLVGFPIAHVLARQPEGRRELLLLLVILPFWTSFLIRVYAWIGILKPEGLLNAALLWLGLISSPLQIMNTGVAVMIGLVYSYLPFMVLPLYATLVKMDHSLLEAAQDLGATPARAFRSVTLPLAAPGIAAGALLCFIPMMGEFVIPDLLGGSDTLMIGRTLWSEFFSNRDWPMASAIAVVLLAVLLAPILAWRRLEDRAADGEAGQ
ncbi:ABC transporter permease [Camelimonas lactis]|uniref:Putrescine transport system permease protein n=1 Tax=Camelimonas lactis TaxID=659006 RepID=A0A4V2RXG2_9HYPH|nr:ABC transporter permease subunit [Camelimonas lactis]TCO13679.1 putrescine transport system permease protein [Camelimonas lactis]